MNFKHTKDSSKQGGRLQTKGIQQHWRIPLYLSVALLVCSVFNTTLFHTLIELFAIGIAIMSFVVSWNTYSFSRNLFLLYLGCGYFWIGVIDLFHTLSFKDLMIFESLDTTATIQFWIVGRFLEAFILLLAPFALIKTVKPSYIFLSIGLVSSLALVAIFSHNFPNMFVVGTGLTQTKIISEYIIIFILVLAAIHLSQKRYQIEASTKQLLLVSIALTIIAELCFTLYVGFSAPALLIGHVFKFLSFWAIYQALIESALTRPFQSLSRVVKSYDTVNDATVIIDQYGIIQQANKIVREKFEQDIIGKHCHEVLHSHSITQSDCPICESIEQKKILQDFEFYDDASMHWYEASLSALHFSENFSTMVHTLRKITARKKSEEQFASLSRVYRVLSHTNQAIARIQDKNILFQNVCDIAIEHGGLTMAWIGSLEKQIVRPEFFAGSESGYLQQMQMRIDDSEWSKGPVGIAAKTKKVSCVNDVINDPDFWPWREAAIKRGYAALAAVPIFFNNQVVAIFTLYSAKKNVFDQEMLALLTSLSDDISAAIFHIHQTKLKSLAEQTVRKLSSALEQSADAVFITNTEGLIEYVNPGFSTLTGYSATEAIGQFPSILKSNMNDKTVYYSLWKTISSGKQWRGELRNKRKDGSLFWSMQSVSPIKDQQGNITHYVSTSTDNTELHEAQETIEQLAFYDPLTKLANRRLLKDRLEQALISADNHNEMVAVLLFDLDNFKTVNDSLGHDLGDQLLQHISHILTKHVRTEDTVARLGGDEFTIIINAIKGESCVIEIASKILDALSVPVQLSGNQLVVSSSIGIALYPQDGKNYKELLRNADLAMYHAKDSGKNRFQFFQHEMNENAQGRLALENKLRRAVDKKSFNLVYQPQVNMSDGNIFGFEALIRWIDEDGNFISPDVFIPLAEETGLIEIIGDWVIEQAFHDWQILYQAGFCNARMAVNVAAFQFRHAEHLCTVIKNAVSNHLNCTADRFTVELTEGTLIENIDETIKALNTLKALGVCISIDDFGTGYSSLSYLKRFPIDQLKIDKSFIQDLSDNESDDAIVTAIIAIAQKLDMKVIAEGVETEPQAVFLQKQHCVMAQGYLYHRPMPVEQLIELKNSGKLKLK